MKSPLKTSPLNSRNRRKQPDRVRKNEGKSKSKHSGLHNMNHFGRRVHCFQQNVQSRDQDSNFEPIGRTISNYLETLATQGKEAFKSVIRSAKVLKSSAFEALLLKATWPEDVPVPELALQQILEESIPAFEKYMELYRKNSPRGIVAPPQHSVDGYSGCDDPYYMTNHKLYMKMIESDWRTTLKSLYIFHTIFRESSPAICDSFRKAMMTMLRKRALKYQTDHYRYFDPKMIANTDIGSEDVELERFVTRYTEFVLHRVKHFSHSYIEMKEMLSTLSDRRVKMTLISLTQSMKLLKVAQHSLELGLSCSLLPQFDDKAVAVQSYKLVAKDVM